MKNYRKTIMTSCLILLATFTFAQVVIGITSPDSNSALEVSSTTGGILIPSFTATTMPATSTDGMMIRCSNCPNSIYLYDGAEWLPVGILPTQNTPLDTGIVDIQDGGITYNDVRSLTGAVWLDRNLGATAVALTTNSTNAYGRFYQWGREWGDDRSACGAGLICSNSQTDSPANGTFYNGFADWRVTVDDNLWYRGSNSDPCPAGYSVPSDYALEKELNSWSTKNATGAIDSPLKLPSAGDRLYGGGTVYYVGTYGFYWSSTPSGSDARLLVFSNNKAYLTSFDRAFGFSVRCSKD